MTLLRSLDVRLAVSLAATSVLLLAAPAAHAGDESAGDADSPWGKNCQTYFVTVKALCAEVGDDSPHRNACDQWIKSIDTMQTAIQVPEGAQKEQVEAAYGAAEQGCSAALDAVHQAGGSMGVDMAVVKKKVEEKMSDETGQAVAQEGDTDSTDADSLWGENCQAYFESVRSLCADVGDDSPHSATCAVWLKSVKKMESAIQMPDGASKKQVHAAYQAAEQGCEQANKAVQQAAAAMKASE